MPTLSPLFICEEAREDSADGVPVEASGRRHDHQLAVDDLSLVRDVIEVFDCRLAPRHIAETTTSEANSVRVLRHTCLELTTAARREASGGPTSSHVERRRSNFVTIQRLDNATRSRRSSRDV